MYIIFMKKIYWFCVLLVFAVSCSGKQAENAAVDIALSDESEITQDEENIVESYSHRIGYINNDYLRVRSGPGTNSEILGYLNAGDCVTVTGVSDGKEVVSGFENYWYEITASDDISGWVFGEYLVIPTGKIAPEFEGLQWHQFYGGFTFPETLHIDDLTSCTWYIYSAYLYFSEKGHFALLGRGNYEFGSYTLRDNTVYFFPPVEIFRFMERYKIEKMVYSTKPHLTGSAVLKVDDGTVVFTPLYSKGSKIGDIVSIHERYCEVIGETGKVNKNGYLFALPDLSSKNLFLDDYYGRRATQIDVVKVAKTIIDDTVWYYTFFDFTSGDPIDGGGPFYYGWLTQDYFADDTGQE